MYLIDKHNGAAALELVNHALEAFLELTAVHRARHQRAHIQLHHTFIQQQCRHVPLHNALRQALHDSSLANARLTNQGRVIFCAPRKDLDDAFDFFLTPDDRVELTRFR